MELSVSTARPLTPSLCPPFWLARGRTAHVSKDARSAVQRSRRITQSCARIGVGVLTIADPLPRLAGHLVADQSALSKPMLHVTVGDGAARGRRRRQYCRSRSNGVNARRHSR